MRVPASRLGVAALGLALATSACIPDGSPPLRERTGERASSIVGGTPSSPTAFPATGMLVAANRLVCTATLIGPDVVLTAAHCLEPPQFGWLSFTLDPDATDGMSNMIDVDYVHQHPNFDPSVDEFIDLAVRNDIGIAILAEPITDVALERLADAAAPVAGGEDLSVCGYGRVAWNMGAPVMKRDALVVVDRAEGFEFSTTADDPQPCSGDSGAPLFVDGPNGRQIVGVVSRAMGRSDKCDTGAIITRVAPYSGWIAAAAQARAADEGCRASRGGSLAPLAAMALLVLLPRARRRRPRDTAPA